MNEFEPRRSDVEHATSRSQRLPILLNLYELAGKKHVSLKLECQCGTEPAISDVSSRQLQPLHWGPRPCHVGPTRGSFPSGAHGIRISKKNTKL